MGTIFVAYGGEPEERTTVLTFAAERAAASGDDLFVYHVQETADESAEALRAEIADVVERTAPGVEFEVDLNFQSEFTEDANVSKQKRLTDAVLSGGEYEYVVMGEVERGAIEGLVLPSMTEAVLETHEVPVLLVPV
jgi:nucleotide-binding universal stress UspA family protein